MLAHRRGIGRAAAVMGVCTGLTLRGYERGGDILAALDHLDDKWGGLGPYLAAHGLSEAEQEALRERLNG